MGSPPELVLLTSSEMAEVDRRAVISGVPSLTLMENAGRAVADAAARMVPAGTPIAVLCGPGNNGGDGFVAARLLSERGHEVRVACLVPISDLQGDAAVMAGRWSGATLSLLDRTAMVAEVDRAGLVIDAIFGAGFNRRLPEPVEYLLGHLSSRGARVLAIDVPSGVDGNTGTIRTVTAGAERTVTFFRAKPGHYLMPARPCIGELDVVDIGIPPSVLDAIAPLTFLNRPRLGTPPHGLWHLPQPSVDGHKYSRGHAVIVSGPAHATGAARLAARGALRVGAGLVTVASPIEAVAINAAHLTAIMVAPFDGPRGLGAILSDARRNAVLIGPAAGVGLATRLLAQVVLEFEAAVVLDADALTSFTLDHDDDPEPVAGHLFTLIGENPSRPVVMTPHEGEFARLFPDLAGPKLDRARAAAAQSGAIVVLKGPDTIIAHPDGQAAINANAPPWLATAGSGDVLAGFITGLLAQGMPPFEAACAAVWLHGACANRFGPGLIAEDLAEMLPHVLQSLQLTA